MTIQIDTSRIMSVYSGARGACMCGCAGKHTYAKAWQAQSTAYRGYEVTDKEVNDKTVRLICNKIMAAGDAAVDEGDCVWADVGGRSYVAYKVNDDKIDGAVARREERKKAAELAAEVPVFSP